MNIAENTTEKTNRAAAFVMSFLLACAWLLSDRMSTGLFLFSYSYRMQTMYPILSLFTMSVIYLAFIFYAVKKHLKINYGILAFYCAIFLFYFIPTAYYGEAVSRWVDSFVWSVPAILLVGLMMSSEHDGKIFVHAVSIMSIIISALNLLFILFPGLYSVVSEWREEYFMGFHTLIGFQLLFGLFFSMLDMHLNGNKAVFIICLALVLANHVLMRSGVGLIGIFVFALYFIPPVRRLVEKTDANIFVVLIIIIFLVLVFGLQTVTSLAPVRHLLEDVLHKETTLSGRLYVWQHVMDEVKRRPVFGYGMWASTELVYEPSRYNSSWQHAHNAFLQTLHEGGLMTLFAGIAMLFYSADRINAIKDERIGGLFKITLFTVLVMYQADFYSYYTWFPVAILCHMACQAARPAAEPFTRTFDSSLRKIFRKPGGNS